MIHHWVFINCFTTYIFIKLDSRSITECLEPSYKGQYKSQHVFWSFSQTLQRCAQWTFSGPAPFQTKSFRFPGRMLINLCRLIQTSAISTFIPITGNICTFQCVDIIPRFVYTLLNLLLNVFTHNKTQTRRHITLIMGLYIHIVNNAIFHDDH